MKKKISKGMETLNYSSTIEKGIYAGETLYSCLSYYGRKVILELLKYYDVPEVILKAYHYHKATPEERMVWEQKKAAQQVSRTLTAKLTSPTYDDIEPILEDYVEEPSANTDADETYYSSEVSWGNYNGSVLYDPEDETIGEEVMLRKRRWSDDLRSLKRATALR